MNKIFTIIVLTLLSCNAQHKNQEIIEISDQTTRKVERTKLTKELWSKYGFFNIETFNPEFEYYISDKTDDLKVIERVYEHENYIWLCFINQHHFYKDHAEVAYDNAEGFLTVRSEITDDTIIIKTWNDFSEIKSTIDTVRIVKKTFRNKTKENKVVGTWINKTSNLSFTLTLKDKKLYYTFTSPKRSFTNTAYITHNNLIVFNGFEWSEYAGGTIDDEGTEKHEAPPLPKEIGCAIDFENNKFIIQNYGNAMNYFVIIEEAEEKYVQFVKQL
ncbi:hypothetical protein [Tenacibaculum agarivorans]|uniref:hypothetical protein n=1 Tax=Tenacibaculum agarivorans TaxID=1908389 RepID=UPI00094B9D8C|nr:hypothetical protein [Tenacibaculum agarivorans]